MYDLHCHTNCSDGSLSPQELIAHAKKLGLTGLSITDHDTTKAYETAIPAAKEAGLRLGSGVEFSSDFEGTSVHILGYDYALESRDIQALCDRHHIRRQERNRGMLEKLREKGMPIEEADLLKLTKGSTAGRPHIAFLMMEKGYVKDLKEAFHKFLGEGKVCYVPGEKISAEETIAVIQKARGKAFLAHPHLMHQRLDQILKLPFDGIECYYARLSPERWLKVAKKKDWLVSGGSDFHGASKVENPLGCSIVNQEIFDTIFQSPVA